MAYFESQYRMSETERRNRDGLIRLNKLHNHQLEEMTTTMLYFREDKYALKIVEEKFGFMTVHIKNRELGMRHEYTLKFKKKDHKSGVIWNFRDAGRLHDLHVEPNHPELKRHFPELR